MNQLHEALMESNRFYADFHKHNYDQIFQWVVLLFVGLLISGFVVSRISHPNQPSGSRASLAAGGNKTVAVVVFDYAQNQTINLNTVSQTFFGGAHSVVNYFTENALGTTTYSPASTGGGIRFVTRSSGNCDGSGWPDWTSAERGNIPADYYVYIFPAWGNCPVGGWSVVGRSNEAWLSASASQMGTLINYPDYAVHELLHSMGAQHTGSCSGSFCSSVTGGVDPYDVLGHQALMHTSAFHKERVGWMTAQTASSAGYYNIDSINFPSTGNPNAIKVPIGGTGKYYYVEYHASYGAFDSGNPTSSGVLIRLAPFSPSAPNYFDSAIIGGVWTPGGSVLVNSLPPVAIAVCSAGPSSATVEVRFNTSSSPCTGAPPPVTCVRNPPTVSVNPSSGQRSPGEKMVFKVAIVNNDTNCPPSTFNSEAQMPGGGWRGKPAIRSEVVGAGQENESRKFKVYSPLDAVPGSYNITYTVSSPDHAPVSATPVVYQVGTGSEAEVLSLEDSPLSTITLCGSDRDSTVAYGTVCTLSWRLDYASSPASCQLDPQGLTGTSGSTSVTITSSTSYRVTCSAGNATSMTVLNVTVSGSAPPPPPPPPNPLPVPVTISALDSTIASGSSTYVTWSSNGQTDCSVGPLNWSGTSGTRSTGPIYATQTWTATCHDSIGNTVAASIVINVEGSPPPSCGGGYVHVNPGQSGVTYLGPGNGSTPGGIWWAYVGTTVKINPGSGFTSGSYDGVVFPASLNGSNLSATNSADVIISGSDWIYYNGASGCSLGAAEIKFFPTGSTPPPQLNPTVRIEAPLNNAHIPQGTYSVVISGWALDNTTQVETAITHVDIYVDGVYVGKSYNVSRTDVCLTYPNRVGCPNVGYTYTWNTSKLTKGSHTITVKAYDNDSNGSHVGQASVLIYYGQ